MFGVQELKERIEVTETTVECPVKDCQRKVCRQRRFFRREDRFKCPEHSIYISPSTFEYASEWDNLLWKRTADRHLLKRIKTVKRESRMARDRSEDAVSWNVFRYLERNNLVDGFLSSTVGYPLSSSEVIYWSYSQQDGTSWSALNRARTEFGERLSRSSEPDIIIRTDRALIFIEAKLTAGNKTGPSNPDYTKKYLTGGDGWFSRVFHSDYDTVAKVEKKYELMRFWLLGTWMAEQLDLDFYLVNLVRAAREKEIEAAFGMHTREESGMHFMRLTWEGICEFVKNSVPPGPVKEPMTEYFRNKSLGYDSNGKLKKAFSV